MRGHEVNKLCEIVVEIQQGVSAPTDRPLATTAASDVGKVHEKQLK